MKQGVDQGAGPVAVPRMDNQSGGLSYDYQVIVLEHGINRYLSATANKRELPSTGKLSFDLPGSEFRYEARIAKVSSGVIS